MSVYMQKSERTVCAKKFRFLNPAACSCKNGKYLGSTIDDLAAVSYEIIDTPKIVPTTTASAKSTSTNFFINHHDTIDRC